jgi:hypothetical protein
MSTVIEATPNGRAIMARPDHQAPLETGAGAAMALIDRIVRDPSVSVERVASAFDFYERMERAAARRAFDEAMAAAKAEMPTILKTCTVDYTNKQDMRTYYKHEDLAGISKVVDPVLAKHGLSYRWRTASAPGQPVTVTCVIAHRMGHSEETSLSAGADQSGGKNSIQAIGSAVSYLQRYTLKAALGLAAAHDDDGRGGDPPAEPEKLPAPPTGAADGFITAEQAEELTGLIAKAGANIDRLLKFAKAESLPDIRASDYQHIKALLLRKLNTQESRI